MTRQTITVVGDTDAQGGGGVFARGAHGWKIARYMFN